MGKLLSPAASKELGQERDQLINIQAKRDAERAARVAAELLASFRASAKEA